MSELVIGIDVGGTKLAGIVAGADGPVIVRTRRREEGPIDRQVVALATELRDASPTPTVAVGVAAPGRIDAPRGIVDLAVNLGARPIPLAKALEEATGVPTFVEHDARAVVRLLAAGDATANLAYLSVGTGISAGVVVGGRPVIGAAGLAGEVGHQLADPAGPPCTCGLTGCLEAIASGPAIAREARARGSAANSSPFASTADVYDAAEAGDPVAAAVVRRAAAHLAAAIRGLVLGFGVDHVVVGGGVTHAGRAFETPLRNAIALERAASALVDGAMEGTTIEILADDPLVGARGAALVAREARHRDHAPAPAPGEEVGHR